MPDEPETSDLEIELPRPNKCYLCDSISVHGKCIRCNKFYCDKDTSKFDSRYCNECMNDITIEETKFTRTTQEYDEDTDTVHTETRSCKNIQFKGIDWMFECRRLSEMSDTDAKVELEYHRYWVSFLENDLVARTVKNYRMKVQTELDAKHEKRAARIQTHTETKVRKVVKTTAAFDPIKFAQELLKMGIKNLDLGQSK